MTWHKCSRRLFSHFCFADGDLQKCRLDFYTASSSAIDFITLRVELFQILLNTSMFWNRLHDNDNRASMLLRILGKVQISVPLHWGNSRYNIGDFETANLVLKIHCCVDTILYYNFVLQGRGLQSQTTINMWEYAYTRIIYSKEKFRSSIRIWGYNLFDWYFSKDKQMW